MTQLQLTGSENPDMGRHAAKDAKDAKLKEPDPVVDQLARTVLDAAFEVHRTLGPGFLESVYEEALAVELALRGVPFRRQVTVPVVYKDVPVGQARLDLLVGERLVIELKATEGTLPIHVAQLISYLNATRLQLGLLVNFNVRWLKEGIKRIVLGV